MTSSRGVAGPRPAAVDGGHGRRLAADEDLPGWLRPVVARAASAALPDWVLHATEQIPPGARPSAVLMLLAEGTEGPDVLLTRRATTLKQHPGQPAFPGGAREPGETDVAAALREAQEETGLDPAGVTPAAELPRLFIRPSGFAVRPVLAHWRSPGAVRAVDPAETAAVARVPLADLADPENRGTIVIPLPHAGELQTPAFTVAGLTVWGFTAGLVDLLLTWGGWAQDWDRGRHLPLPER